MMERWKSPKLSGESYFYLLLLEHNITNANIGRWHIYRIDSCYIVPNYSGIKLENIQIDFYYSHFCK